MDDFYAIIIIILLAGILGRLNQTGKKPTQAEIEKAKENMWKFFFWTIVVILVLILFFWILVT